MVKHLIVAGELTERWMRDTVMEHARTGEPVLDHYGRDITGTVKRIISDMEANCF